jgi:hypothetical protein
VSVAAGRDVPTHLRQEAFFRLQSHDRFALEYDESLELPAPWREFIAELESPRYRRFLRRMFGRGGLSIAFHWHYTPNGCSVSPHCDAMHKLGSHIFYFNTTEDWDPTWGGETVVLDDHGRFGPKSAPAWEDFDTAAESNALGNYSLIFARGESSCTACARSTVHDRLRAFHVAVNDRLRATAGSAGRGARERQPATGDDETSTSPSVQDHVAPILASHRAHLCRRRRDRDLRGATAQDTWPISA